LDLALARIRNNVAQLRGPIERSSHAALARRLAGRITVPNLRYCLGAALAVGVIGIGVNALLLQRERHPAPLFGSGPQPPAAPAATPPPKPAPAEQGALPAPALAPAALPPARPAASAENSAPASDPIGDFLTGESHGDGARLVLAAQSALSKLGYPVKADGNEGSATQQALRDFERSHGLPSSTEITERLVKQLTQAARVGGR
jgi:hypothetical protein